MLKMNSLMIAFVVVLSAFGSLLRAEEERPTVEHVLDFLKEKMPESMDLLERVKEEEGEEGYAEVWPMRTGPRYSRW